MLSLESRPGSTVARRALLAAAIACGVASVAPARAEIKGLEIIAPAGPGGGYDQLARATQEVLQKAESWHPACRCRTSRAPAARSGSPSS